MEIFCAWLLCEKCCPRGCHLFSKSWSMKIQGSMISMSVQELGSTVENFSSSLVWHLLTICSRTRSRNNWARKDYLFTIQRLDVTNGKTETDSKKFKTHTWNVHEDRDWTQVQYLHQINNIYCDPKIQQGNVQLQFSLETASDEEKSCALQKVWFLSRDMSFQKWSANCAKGAAKILVAPVSTWSTDQLIFFLCKKSSPSTWEERLKESHSLDWLSWLFGTFLLVHPHMLHKEKFWSTH